MKSFIFAILLILVGCHPDRSPSSDPKDEEPAHEKYDFNPANQ